MGFPRQEFWSGLPFPPPQDLPDPEIEPASPVAPALSGRLFFTTSATWKSIPLEYIPEKKLTTNSVNSLVAP